MAKTIWVRPLQESDSEKFIEWSIRNMEKNLFDPDVLRYPQTVVYCAHDGEPIMFLPIQLVPMLESLAPNPDATEAQQTAALKELVQTAAFQAKKLGMGEIYFISKDEDTIKFAQKHGFEDLPWHTLRLKLDRLEEKSNVPD